MMVLQYTVIDSLSANWNAVGSEFFFDEAARILVNPNKG